MNWTQRPVAAPLLMRLRQSSAFGSADLAAIAALPVETRHFEPHAPIVTEGRRGDRLHVVLDGWAARFKILENGSRQIPALVLSGDACDLDMLYLERVDWGVIALTRCTVASLPRDGLLALLDRHRGLRDAFGRMTACENAIATQWTVCLGRRSARERLAHLLCDLHARMDMVGGIGSHGGAGGAGYLMPLTQDELADVLGLTAVHVNRTLQQLRAEGLVTLRDQRLTIPDEAALRRAGGFDGRYLHLSPADAGTIERTRGTSVGTEAYA